MIDCYLIHISNDAKITKKVESCNSRIDILTVLTINLYSYRELVDVFAYDFGTILFKI